MAAPNHPKYFTLAFQALFKDGLTGLSERTFPQESLWGFLWGSLNSCRSKLGGCVLRLKYGVYSLCVIIWHSMCMSCVCDVDEGYESWSVSVDQTLIFYMSIVNCSTIFIIIDNKLKIIHYNSNQDYNTPWRCRSVLNYCYNKSVKFPENQTFYLQIRNARTKDNWKKVKDHFSGTSTWSHLQYGHKYTHLF